MTPPEHTKYLLDVDSELLRELLAAPISNLVLSDFDLVFLAFLLANEPPQTHYGDPVVESPAGPRPPGLSPPDVVTAERMATTLLDQGFSPASPREGFADSLLAAARADRDIFLVDRRRVYVTGEHAFFETARAITVRPATRDVWGMAVRSSAEGPRRVRFHDPPAALPPSGAPSEGALDVTPATVRDVLASPNAEAILSDCDRLILAFMLAANLKPAAGTALSADELATEIEQSRAARRPPIPELKGRLKAAARALPTFGVSLIRRRIYLKRPDELEDATIEILTRPLIRRRIEAAQQEERARALKAAPRPPQPTPQEPEPPREAREKPPEMPPPPAIVKPTVHIADVTEAEILRALGGALLPCAKLEREPVRPAHARASAERFLLRNGLVEVGQVATGTASYLVARLGFAVEADEHREGEAVLVVSDDGRETDESFDVSHEPDTNDSSRAEPRSSSGMAYVLAARARGAMARAAQPILQAVSGRHARAHAQSAARFVALAAALDADGRDAQMARLTVEREDDLAAVRERFAARVLFTRLGCSWVVVPAATVAVTLRRRKATRTILLHVPAGANRVDRLCCEGCGRVATAAPAACDDRLHLLCEACAPTAQGRIACPRCG